MIAMTTSSSMSVKPERFMKVYLGFVSQPLKHAGGIGSSFN
jgi:hypothetical protein